jgi:glycosyltransferase involved in cell wall biosynthesis
LARKKIIRVTTVPISLKILLKDQLKFINQYYEVVAVSSEGKELHDVARDELVRTIPLNMSRRFTPLKDLIALFKMVLLIKKENPDIVHSHTPKAGIISMLAALFCNVPIRFHTVAGLPVMETKGLKRVILLFVEWLTCKCATKVFPNSDGLKKFLIESVKVPNSRLKVLGSGSSNGVDTNYFKFTPEIERSSEIIKQTYEIRESFIFAFIGRMVKDKGVEELLDAFNKLNVESHNIRLLMVGFEEPITDPLSLQSRNILKSNKNIITTGFLDDVRPVLGFADCLVLPSYREGFPNVVLQAGCMNTPCIVSDINGCNEIIQNEVNGLIVAPKNSDALYATMKRLMLDETLLRNLGTQSRSTVVEKYDRIKFHKLLLREYKSILAEFS